MPSSWDFAKSPVDRPESYAAIKWFGMPVLLCQRRRPFFPFWASSIGMIPMHRRSKKKYPQGEYLWAFHRLYISPELLCSFWLGQSKGFFSFSDLSMPSRRHPSTQPLFFYKRFRLPVKVGHKQDWLCEKAKGLEAPTET